MLPAGGAMALTAVSARTRASAMRARDALVGAFRINAWRTDDWVGRSDRATAADQPDIDSVPTAAVIVSGQDDTRGSPGARATVDQTGMCAAAAVSAPATVEPRSGASCAVPWSNVTSPSSRMRWYDRWSWVTSGPVWSSVAACK